MSISVKCNLCGGDHYSVLYHARDPKEKSDSVAPYKITDHEINVPVRVVVCLRCGLTYANPQPDNKTLISSYAEMTDEPYLEEEQGRRAAARLILNFLKKQKKSGTLLDIGCATGFLLDEARKDGWDVFGVELSDWAAGYAQNNLSLKNITKGTVHEAHYPDNFFDAIILKDVIEHLRDPRATLLEIRRILKPNGVICVNTPNINSLLSKILKAKWWGIKQLHLFYFTPASLAKMFEATGFVSLKIRSHARVFTLNYWLNNFGRYNPAAKWFIKFLSRYPSLEKKLICLDLGDQMEIFARKSRQLQYIHELEPTHPNPGKRKLKCVAVLPAYNAAKTLQITYNDIPKNVIDEIILVDDASRDDTVAIAKELGIKVFVHEKNKGYGANQKTCYTKALELGADIVVMVHPDYQYDPTVIPQLIEPIQKGEADAVFGSRMMHKGALEGGMPLWKHNANILLTALENVTLGTYLTEYHSGFRAYSAKYLRSVNFAGNSDGFIFDTEIIVQGMLKFMRIAEIPIKTRYFDEASSIKFWPSVNYGLGILKTLFKYLLHQHGIRFKQFE
ncbi:MAG: methyltransferase domain-containing protein [Candidatus Omnitrophota bacterium]